MTPHGITGLERVKALSSFPIPLPKYLKLSYTSKFHTMSHLEIFKSKSTTTNLVAYLDFITPLVHSQLQVNATYFDFRNASDLVPHPLLLRKLVLAPPLFSVVKNDLCSAVKYSDCCLFSDDVKIRREIKSPYDRWTLQSDVNNVKSVVYCRLHKSKRQQNQSHFLLQKNKLSWFWLQTEWIVVTRTDCVRDLGVLTDTNLHFHIFSHAIGLLGFIWTATLRFSSLHSLLTPILHSSQTPVAICLCCVELYHFFRRL
jgi:hypothetical protein